MAAIGGTIAYFSDKQVSAGNIMVAGTIDLTIDHAAQNYNGVDCKTCNVEVVSGTDNMVVARSQDGVTTTMSENAVLVDPINSRWTANVGNPNAKWIWATNPTAAADTYGTSYTFAKKFTWYGPFNGITLNFGVGSDNSIVVYLNGVEVGRNDGEFGYQTPITITDLNPIQGENELKFVVTNWNQNHDGASNPGGLLYSLTINGNCGDNYFKNNCTLFGEKKLTLADHFWKFDDIKPGDWGTNLISLHVKTNDAKVCSYLTKSSGDLGTGIYVFAWADDGDGIYETGEATVWSGKMSEFTGKLYSTTIAGNSTAYMGVAWCAGSELGAQAVAADHSNAAKTCSPADMGDEYQGKSFTSDFGFYAVQARHNDAFTCPAVSEAFPQPTQD